MSPNRDRPPGWGPGGDQISAATNATDSDKVLEFVPRGKRGDTCTVSTNDPLLCLIELALEVDRSFLVGLGRALAAHLETTMEVA